MRSQFITIVISASILSIGCHAPDEPHPKNITRFAFIANTPLTFVLPAEFAVYDGYFESSISRHVDTSDSRYENDASFFNHLGNSYLPDPPFFISANNSMLFDTSVYDQYNISYSNFDSLDFLHPIIWRIDGGKDVPSFSDTLLPPQKVEIIFPLPNTKNILPSQPFSIKYNVIGSDSVFVQLLVFNTDTTSPDFFFQRRLHAANTGSFDVSDKIIPYPPFPVSIHISLAAVTQKTHGVRGQNYLIRAGIIDNANIKFSD